MSLFSRAFSAVISPVNWAISRSFDYLVDYVTPDIPGGAGPVGDPLQNGDIDANTARQGSVVPVMWGTNRRFPDKIAASRSYYQDKRVRITNHLLCIGVGDFQINSSDVLVGKTPFGSLGTDASYTIYGPGESLAADDRSKGWYIAPEVGGTSSGGGLDLQSTQPSGSAVVADTVAYSGFTATLSGDYVQIPESWVVGTQFVLLNPKTITIGTDGTRNTFTGDLQDIEPFIGMVATVSIAGTDYDMVVNTWTDNAGVDDVLTFDDDLSVAFNELPSGSFRVSIGYRGNLYEVTALTSSVITFDRLTDLGAVDGSWSGFDSVSIADFSIYSETAEAVNWIGPYAALPEGETTQTVEVDIFMPSGLMSIDGDGDKKTLTRSVIVGWRDADAGGSWTEETFVFTEFTRDAIGFTRTISLPSAIRPEIRMRRVEPVVTTGSSTVFETLQWQSLKALLDVRPTSYPDVTTMAVTIRSGDRITGVSDNQISVVATAIRDSITANTISGFIDDMASDIGLPSSQLDSAAISGLEATYWTPRGETFDYIFDTQVTVDEAIDLALSAGMTSRIDSLGRVSAVREGIRTATHAITPHHMTSDFVWSGPMNQNDVYNGVDVKYIDPESWEEETVQCRLDGVTATRIEEITVDGVHSKTRAWRIGMRRLRKNVSQQYSITGSTEMEARNFSPFERVIVTDDIAGISAEIYRFIDNGTTATLSLEEDIVASSFADPRLIVIDHEGVPSAEITPSSLTDYTITIASSDISFVPVTDGSIDRATVIVYESATPPYDIIVSGISSSSLTETDFSGVAYSDTFYADDDNSPE